MLERHLQPAICGTEPNGSILHTVPGYGSATLDIVPHRIDAKGPTLVTTDITGTDHLWRPGEWLVRAALPSAFSITKRAALPSAFSITKLAADGIGRLLR